MATPQQGSNATHHVAYVTLGGVNWEPFQDVDGPKISTDGEVRFIAPGSNFETTGGGNGKIDTISLKRHGKRSRDAKLAQQFVNAKVKGTELVGSISYHEIAESGLVDADPWITLDVLVADATYGKSATKSGDSEFEVTLSPFGDPR